MPSTEAGPMWPTVVLDSVNEIELVEADTVTRRAPDEVRSVKAVSVPALRRSTVIEPASISRAVIVPTAISAAVIVPPAILTASISLAPILSPVIVPAAI